MVSLDLWQNRSNSNSPRTLWRSWDNFAQDFDSFFTDFDKARSAQQQSSRVAFTPPMDVEENAKAFVLSFDLPGFKEEDLSLDLNGRTLTVLGKRTRVTEDKLHRSEKTYGEFRRSLLLPENIKTDAIEAKYENGVLDLTIPKSQPAEARKISIGRSNTAAPAATRNPVSSDSIN